MKGRTTARGGAALVVAVGLIGAVIAMSWADARAERPVFGLLTIALAGALAIVATTYGLVHLGARPRSDETAGAGARPSYRHVVRIGLVVGTLVAAAAAGRALLVPHSYGEFGFYRGDAAREAMVAATPLHQGRERCAICHDDVAATHAKDVHGTVECESCHGPGLAHLQAVTGEDPPGSDAHVFVPQTREPCLWCHRRLAARPSTFPQVDPAEHYAFLGVTDETTPCMKCHSPHEPLFLDHPLRDARLHPVIQQCRDCHAAPPDAAATRPDDHPVVFECAYCHAEIAADFAGRPHAAVGCGRCHLFHRESETAGRIVKNRDPRFCLLCHRAAPFRGGNAPRRIDWPAHRDAQGPGLEQIVCVDCHADKIHRGTEALRRAAARGDR